MEQSLSHPVYLSVTDGLVKLLKSCDENKMLHALKRLHDLVDVHSHDMKQYIGLVEVISNDLNFRYKQLAKLLLARIYFYNGDQKKALEAALTIPELFEQSFYSEFSETLIGEMIDAIATSNKPNSTVDNLINKLSGQNLDEPKSQASEFKPEEVDVMENIIFNVVNECGECYDEKQAIGIALELQNTNSLERILDRQSDPRVLIRYMVSIVTRYFSLGEFTSKVYHLAIDKLYKQNPIDYPTLFFCLTRTKQPGKIADVLIQLAVNEDNNPDNCCIGTQLCFDLYENAMPKLIEEILVRLKYCGFYREGKRITFDSSTKKKVKNPLDRPAYTSVVLEPCSDEPSTLNERELVSSAEFIELSPEGQEQRLQEFQNQVRNARLKYIYEKLTKFIIVLRGKATVRLWFEYIIKTMRSDALTLRVLRTSVKSSLSMTAVIFANGIMHCGTTGDSFARENADWFSRCSNWAKFAFVASYGLIHAGNHADGMRVLGSFLPKLVGGNADRKYEESGALCALGFIFGNRSSKAKDFILRNFYSATDPVVFHGCCLGIGLSSFGCFDADLIRHLWKNIEGDSPIKSLGASICYGMVAIGLSNEISFASITQLLLESKHEKTKLGLSLLMALVHLQTEKQAWTRINDLIKEKKAACRLAAAYTIGTAFVGTGDIEAVQALWQLVIFDVDDHVKRASIISLAFVLLRDKPQLYDIMTQLFNSHNSMVRCASAFALGVVFAGTGHPDAYLLVSTLYVDIDVRVRQTAYIAASMIMMHLNEEKAPASKVVRDALFAVINNTKSIDQLVRFGAIVGIGLIDAGGKNMATSYFTSDGSIRVYSIVGMLLFSASYYWYPLIGFVTMALVPAAAICVKDDFSIPIIKLYATEPSSHFKYSAFTQLPRKTSKSKTTSKLSAHRKSRKSKRIGGAGEFPFEVLPTDDTKFVITDGKKGPTLVNMDISTDPVLNQYLKLESVRNSGKTSTANKSLQQNDTKTNATATGITKGNDRATSSSNVLSTEKLPPPLATTTSNRTEGTTTKKTTTAVVSTPTKNAHKIPSLANASWDHANIAAIYDPTCSQSSNKSGESLTTLYNPARVLPCMWDSVKFDESCGYVPFKPVNSGGIIVVKKVGKQPEHLILEPLQVKIVSTKPKSAEHAAEKARLKAVVAAESSEKSCPPSSSAR